MEQVYIRYLGVRWRVLLTNVNEAIFNISPQLHVQGLREVHVTYFGILLKSWETNKDMLRFYFCRLTKLRNTNVAILFYTVDGLNIPVH